MLIVGASLTQSAEAQETETPNAPVSTNIISLGDDTLSPEQRHTVRTLFRMGDNNTHIPETMSFSASNVGPTSSTMFIAATLAEDGISHQAGLLIKAQVNPQTGEVLSYEKRKFPECTEMIGVQSSKDGDTASVLCKTNPGTAGDVIDLVDRYADGGAELKAGKSVEMRLYEWKADAGVSVNIQDEPTKFIVAKNIDTSGRPHSLVFGEDDFTYNNHGTYGISVTTRLGKKGIHTSDSLIIIQRGETAEDYRIMRMRHNGQKPGQHNFKMNFRGWSNSCTGGHPQLISLGYNPNINVDNPWTEDVEKAQYAVLCLSEINTIGAGLDIGGINLTRDNSYLKDDGSGFANNEQNTFLPLQKDGTLYIKGGVGPLLPFGNGWIGVVVGADAELEQLRGNGSNPASKVGIVKFNHKGQVVEPGVQWIDKPAGFEDNYISFPQLTLLDPANGKYLLGFGVMNAKADDSVTMKQSLYNLMTPETFYLQEIQLSNIDDGDGDNGNDTVSITILSPLMPLADGLGWGMTDKMISLGHNKVGWAAYNMDRMTIGPNGEQPNAFANALQLNVYTSTGD